MVRNIKLKEKEILFLKEICKIDILEKYNKNNIFEAKSKSWICLLDSIDLECINDVLAIALMEIGITNGEINDTGKTIDDYIDKFNCYE